MSKGEGTLGDNLTVLISPCKKEMAALKTQEPTPFKSPGLGISHTGICGYWNLLSSKLFKINFFALHFVIMGMK